MPTILLAAMAGLSLGFSDVRPVLALSIDTSTPGQHIQKINISLTGNSSQDFNFYQFDSSLGILTGVSFSFNGASLGSFSLTSTNAELTQARERFTLSWSGSGNPGSPTPIPRNDITDSLSPTFVDFVLNGTQTFNLPSGGDSYTLPTQNYNSFFSYFMGSSTVTSSLSKELQITSTSSSSLTSNVSSLSFGGAGSVATLTYSYTPVPVPAALPVAGALFAYGLLRRQRRRVKFPL